MSAVPFCAPLVWGHGPKVLEVFLEPTCPFSAKAFAKFDELMARASDDRLTLKLRLQSQPWHTFSSVVTRAVLAASTLPGGREAAQAVLAAVFAHREACILEQHARGPNLDLSPRQLLQMIAQWSGVALAAPFERTELEAEMKWQARYARQNGIHATPTFMIDGLVANNVSSGDTVDAWLTALFG